MATYALVFILWTPLNLEQHLWLKPLAATARGVTQFVERPVLTASVLSNPGQFTVSTVPIQRGIPYRFGLEAGVFTNCIPILVALVCVTPSLATFARIGLMFAGSVALFFLNVGALVCAIEAMYLRMTGADAPVVQTPLAPVYRAVDVALGTHMAQLAMLFIVFGPALAFTARSQARQWQTRRNDPCPCGSGKKYKRCCGS